MSREDPQMKIRLPDGLRDQIAAAAKANGRSMNSEIVARLQSTLGYVQGTLDLGDADQPIQQTLQFGDLLAAQTEQIQRLVGLVEENTAYQQMLASVIDPTANKELQTKLRKLLKERHGGEMPRTPIEVSRLVSLLKDEKPSK